MKHIYLWMVASAFMLLVCTGCQEDQYADSRQAVKAIETQLLENQLLTSAEVKGEEYVLTFEKNTITIPSGNIRSFATDKEHWKSVVTFTDGKVYTIPYKGTSLDKLMGKVTVNPSGCSPLGAQLDVHLPVLGRMKVIVHSKPGHATPDVEHTFSSVEKDRMLDILGLYGGYENQVTIVYQDMDGNERGRSDIKIPVEELKDRRLPKSILVYRDKEARLEPGMNLVSSPGEDENDTSIPYMIDADGEIRWILDWSNHPDLNHIAFHCGLSRMKNGNYLTGDVTHNKVWELNVRGEIVRRFDLNSTEYVFHHDATETERGTWLVAVSDKNAKLADGKTMRENDVIIEIDPHKGTILKKWDLANMLDTTRYYLNDGGQIAPNFVQNPSNWAHNNSIVGLGEDYLASVRLQGVIRFTSSGKIKWILTPHKAWKGHFKSLLLRPLHADGTPVTDEAVISGEKNGDDFSWPFGSHDAMYLPNGHILMFDNGYARNFKYLTATSNSTYSRAVEYEVDEKNMTVRQVWEYGRELGVDGYSATRSSVQYLPETGNRLFCPGTNNKFRNGLSGGRIVEINPQTGKVVFELGLTGIMFQRTKRLSLYPDNL